ncbi:hypothetical protein SAMN05444285_11877 [Draconibacterium orientale]|uniref:Uncharacterized protein n=1 Tax=Draconibacterium orientale TaxID=1168034 RepID=A0A1I0G248_9BACT|nr:hypothetical protein SAMN05444285_11877 [Draconibacterium orientale]
MHVSQHLEIMLTICFSIEALDIPKTAGAQDKIETKIERLKTCTG